MRSSAGCAAAHFASSAVASFAAALSTPSRVVSEWKVNRCRMWQLVQVTDTRSGGSKALKLNERGWAEKHCCAKAPLLNVGMQALEVGRNAGWRLVEYGGRGSGKLRIGGVVKGIDAELNETRREEIQAFFQRLRWNSLRA